MLFEGEPESTADDGKPARSGKFRVVGKQSQLTLTPSSGKHFYYALVVQDDKTRLWSAPVWVEQRPTTHD
jgi:hypothetical protein